MAGDETFLIVDDARLARKMVRSYVTRARPELTIFEAAEGEEALKILLEIPTLHFATIDYNMPGMNGIELAAIVKERYPTARIALLTANVQAALRKRAATLGVDFIDKPITEGKICAFIAGVGQIP